MADPENLTALKKAYADTILNTSKEAAARVMASQRKACDYQQELFSSREEALRMLMRLKQMFDSKVKESEMASLNKQKKIEELEAQLGEAEDIVGELRTELRELHDELEKVTNSQMQPPHDQNPNEETGELPVSSSAKDNKSLHTSEAVISSALFAHNGLVGAYDMKGLIYDGIYNMGSCSYKGNGYACTQSYRALERNKDNGNISVSGKTDDVNDEPFIRKEEEEGSRDNPDEVEVLPVESSSRKRKRPKAQSSRSFSDSDTCQVSGNSDVNNSPTFVDAGKEDSRLIKNQSPKDHELRNSDNGTAENSKTDLEAVTSNTEVSGFSKETHVSGEGKRCIKYTFKRKRKKESLTSLYRDSLSDGERENGCCEAPRSGLITKSSVDDHGLAQQK